MNVLLLAPHPFYRERGTPIAVDLVLRVLSEEGHTVHLLTLHAGEDRAYPGVTIHRIASPPLVHDVPPGFTWKKAVCDLYMGIKAVRLVRRLRPDLVHAVEEASVMAWAMRPICGVPYLYDMDSSLPAQLVESRPWFRPFGPVFRWFERRSVRGALAVIPVCPALMEIARDHGAQRAVLLPDISLLDRGQSSSTAAHELAGAQGIRFIYVGNLEEYQGVDLLLEAFAGAVKRGPAMSLIVIGGDGDRLAAYRKRAVALGIGEQVRFLGPRPLDTLAAWLAEADVPVSPRIRGVNTPMKIYSYLASGKPLLATRLPTHTQVLDEGIARLADPEPGAFADAMVALATDEAARKAIGCAGRAYAAAHHTYPAFKRTLAGLYQDLAKELGRAEAEDNHQT